MVWGSDWLRRGEKHIPDDAQLLTIQFFLAADDRPLR
jgi:hypothetical protein